MLPDHTLLQDRYRIVEQIGRGGMGAVYKATDTRLRAVVALKQTLMQGESLSKAFEREARLLASLRHPTLPRVSDHFIDKAGQFLVMEYIAGDDLGAMLGERKAPFPVADVLRWADQLLDVLDYLHTRTPPVIHRDIKPQNLKLTDRGEIILLDFGLAKGAQVLTQVTSTGSIFGYTPHYAALEQIHGTGTDGRSDLYSLAATLYHLLTSRTPVDALTRATAKVNDEADPLEYAADVNPQIPQPVAVVLHQALSLKATHRPPTAAAMRASLSEARREAGPLKPAEPTVIHQVDALPPTPAAPRPPTKTVVHTEDVAPPSARADRPKQGRVRGWLVIVPLVLLAAGGAMVYRMLSGQSPGSVATTSALAAGGAEQTPPAQPSATLEPTPTLDILGAAQGTQTAIAMLGAATITAEADIMFKVDATRTALSGSTQTAVAVVEQGTQEAIAAASAEAATQEAVALMASAEAATQEALTLASAEVATQEVIAAASAQAATVQAAVRQTEAARPTPTARPPAPTRTPDPPTPVPPPTVSPEPVASCRASGGGSKFVGSCSPGPRLSGVSGSCITGRVLASNGAPFQTVLLSVDMRGSTIRVPLDRGTYDPGSGNYSICGLGGGEWGVTVIDVNRGNGIEGNPDQAGSQVRVVLSGADGEHAVVSFRE